jgi:uncharacterized membrane protein
MSIWFKEVCFKEVKRIPHYPMLYQYLLIVFMVFLPFSSRYINTACKIAPLIRFVASVPFLQS